nr:diphosphate--fructose-6-phosphate 1-phosphotransferase [Burkholderiaceae bacterium]
MSKKAMRHAIYAQSGGVTAVINATAVGVIDAVRAQLAPIDRLYAGRNGIVGVLEENLIDTTRISAEDLDRLKQTPGGMFGSCRFKLKSLEADRERYTRLL